MAAACYLPFVPSFERPFSFLAEISLVLPGFDGVLDSGLQVTQDLPLGSFPPHGLAAAALLGRGRWVMGASVTRPESRLQSGVRILIRRHG